MVEDEALVALSFQDALEHAGFAVHHAFDGPEAFEFLQEHHAAVSALITNIRFVGETLDGWAIAKRAREFLSTIPVIYMTGDSAHDHGCLGLSRSMMLQKPFTSECLVSELGRLLSPVTTNPSPISGKAT
jgi:DNA-binding response OmpR family regulator